MAHRTTTSEPPRERILAVRQALGLTQEGLARLLDISSATVQFWERGSRRPGAASMDKLASALRARWGAERTADVLAYLSGGRRPPWLDEEIRRSGRNGHH